jgi:predicted NUDIX family NTP pyrophosphohydrolase
MAATSAGILVYRRTPGGGIEVLLGHMGGPFWARKDAGAWSIPKGEYGTEEGAESAARREFEEELGLPLPDGELIDLGEVRQSRKVVRAWAIEGDLDPATAASNTFEIEWPPGSGRRATFPEIDRYEWFDPATARTKLVKGQVALIDRLLDRLS